MSHPSISGVLALQQSYRRFSQPIVVATAARQCFYISWNHGGKTWTKERLFVTL